MCHLCRLLGHVLPDCASLAQMEAAVDKREAMASSPDNEAAGQELKGSGYTIAATAHAVDTDSWQQVGLLLVIGFNCAYVLSFSNLMMVPLGWGWGVACLLIVGGAAWYANWLLAGLHVIDGQRFIRYRDLMGFVFGRKMYYITWFLQFTTLLLCNMGFILLGARALKAINVEFTHSHARLQWFIAATGTIYFAFAYFVPTISAMRNWLATSAALTVAYDVALLAILVKDGKSDKPKDYTLHGTQAEKVFSALGAIAAILVCNTSGLLPEIQLFTVPIHEAMDTQLQRLDEGMFSRYNLSRRLFSRGVIFGFNVFVTALFPFMGDFVNLFGSFALVPLTFMFPSMVVLKIKGKSGGRWHRVWHWGIIVASTVLGVATTAAAARLIFNNARVYHFFADM
ncbi:proline transporter 1-like isoform X2 [Phragmites australis]|uniref:proline transporter 1-like isoform X2 n=1 Tax=Phragmites australis TaxID=29695 RepID=UPI002D76A2B1|nr:proline transporter 1-like isoform X2 [Phragmites australis]